MIAPFNIERFYVTSCLPYSLVSPTPPPLKKCVHVVVLSQSFESGTSVLKSKRSFFAFNFQAVLAMLIEKDLYLLCLSVDNVSSVFC